MIAGQAMDESARDRFEERVGYSTCLTDEEIVEVWEAQPGFYPDPLTFARAVLDRQEAKEIALNGRG